MAVPFPEAQLEALIYSVIGSLVTLTAVLLYYIKKLHRKLEEDSEEEEIEFETHNIGLSRRGEEVLDELLEKPCLQSELPGRLDVSKATVSNSVKELTERGLAIRKKKGNTYRLEPEMDELEKQQR